MANYTVQNLLDLGFTVNDLIEKGVLTVNPNVDPLNENPAPTQNENPAPTQNENLSFSMDAVQAALDGFRKEIREMIQTQNVIKAERGAEAPKQLSLDDALIGLAKGV